MGPRRQRHLRDRRRLLAHAHPRVLHHRNRQHRLEGDRQRGQDGDHHLATDRQRRRHEQLRRRGARHPGADRLLAHGRGVGPDARGQRRRKPGHHPGRRHPRRARRARRRHEHGRALRRLQRLRDDQPQPHEHAAADGRVLAQVDVRQRRPAGDGVHAELPRLRRRLPHRSQRAAARRPVRRRHRPQRVAQHGLLQPPDARRLAPLRVRARHLARRPRSRSRPTSTARP